MGWAQVIVIAGAGATAALLVRALIGDRSRGRRRCPRCWYDMSATRPSPPPPSPGLVCPECGRDAKHERRLLKSRRRTRWIAASFLPVLVGMGTYIAWFVTRDGWVQRTPTLVLIAASPWARAPGELSQELFERTYDQAWEKMTDRERRLSAFVSRRVVRMSDDPQRVILHAWMLGRMRADDEATVNALVRLAQDHPTLANDVARALGDMSSTRAAVRGLETLIESPAPPNPSLQAAAVQVLAMIKWNDPGGKAPAAVLAHAADYRTAWSLWSISLLGAYDPSDEVREMLLSIAAETHNGQRPSRAIGALVRHSPQATEVRDLAISGLGRSELEEWRVGIVSAIMQCDRPFYGPDGALSSERVAYYTPELKRAMIDAINALPKDARPEFNAAREILRAHPCLAAEERQAIGTPSP